MDKRLSILLIILVISNHIMAQAPGCPNVTITAPGASQGQVTIPCNDCITLTANVLHTGQTNTYTVSSIPYAPPYPFNSGTPILVNIDDRWSGVINLPFTFCFFGQGYNQLIAGSNGVVSFNLADANGFCPWSFSASCPSPNLIRNAIFGVYHDIDPSVSGTMYQAVLGSYPCRTFVVNWNQVAMFSSSCNALKATHQIVMYEATNVIEVYVQNAPLCSSWNSGNKLIGIQNNAGTVGFTPPGRNTGPWSATNEAWRFTPNGAQNYTIQWYNGPTPIGSGPTINVCPTTSTTYTAIATYDNCNFTQVVVQSQMTVHPGTLTTSINPATSQICQGQQSVNITASAQGNGPFTFNWSPASGLSTTTGPTVTASPSATTTYVVTVTDNLGCTGTVEATVQVNPPPDVSVSATDNPICNGASTTVSALGGQNYVWANLGNGQSHVVTPNVTTNYSVTATDANGCTGTAGFTLVVNDNPVISISNPTPDICEGQSANLTASGATSYLWSNAATSANITVSPAVTTTYQVTGTDGNGCTGTASSEVIVHFQPIADFTGTPLSGCIPLNVSFTQQVVSGDPIQSYYWQFGAGGSLGNSTSANPSKIFSAAGSYDVSLTATTTYGCQSSITKPLYITAHPKPNAAFFADPSVAELGNSTITFIDQSVGADLYYWTFGDGNSSMESSPVYTYESAGQFIVVLVVANEYGCVDSTMRYVQILHNIAFYVPNAFTPGNDGLNDDFGPTGVGIKAIDFYIYDRWGKLVFYSNTLDKRWDGKINGMLPTTNSVYTWRANVVFANNIKESFKGVVILIR